MNKVILIGRLTKDPNTQISKSGNAYCTFTLAVNRIKKDEADFIQCKAFGKTAELITNYLERGSQTAIEGTIRTGSHETEQGKKYFTDIIVERVEFIGKSAAPAAAPKTFDPMNWEEANNDTDIPF